MPPEAQKYLHTTEYLAEEYFFSVATLFIYAGVA